MSVRESLHLSEPAPWLPILTGAAAEQAVSAIVDIAEDLRGFGEADSTDPSLFGGWAGLSLFFAYLGRSGLMEGAFEEAERLEERAFEAAAETVLNPTLSGGFVGIAWAGEHLEKNFRSGEVGATEIDEILGHLLERRPWQHPYDLAQGLVGHGVYLLERLPDPTARQLLETAIERLAEIAREDSDGVSWFTPPDLVPSSQKNVYPNGYYNLGMAHGIPGVIALLARTHQAGVARARCRSLLEPAVSWLLARSLPPGSISRFTNVFSPERDSPPARLAWCYGDPGVAVAVFSAALALGREDWQKTSLEIARGAAERSLETSFVRDACLCHGSAGLAHFFNRFFQATGEDVFRQSALSWYEITLKGRKRGERIGGYRYHEIHPERPNESFWIPQADLLEGASGIGLALLAALHGSEPRWDSCLLTSIPTRFKPEP